MQKILVITGSTRPNRKSDQVAEWFMQAASAHKEDFEFELVDLAKIDLPMFDEPMPPLMSAPQNDHTKQWAAKLGEADGYILVTPEYNHGYSAVLKNALDYAYHEWRRKPVGFVSYGVAGGVRAVEQLKPVVVNLEMAPINEQVSLNLFTNWSQEGAMQTTDRDQRQVDNLLEQLKWWGEALKEARNK